MSTPVRNCPVCGGRHYCAACYGHGERGHDIGCPHETNPLRLIEQLRDDLEQLRGRVVELERAATEDA